MFRNAISTLLIALLAGCGDDAATTSPAPSAAAAVESAAEAAAPAPVLPPPYEALALGVTRSQVEAAFPPTEDLSHCAFTLLDRGERSPPPVPGAADAPERARSRCITLAGAAGPTRDELTRLLSATIAVAGTGSNDMQASDVLDGLLLALAQVRGAVRAEAMTEEQLLEANAEEHVQAHEAAFRVAASLGSGTLSFTEGRAQLRFLAAVIGDDCDRLDAAQTRAFVGGALDLGEIRRRSGAAARRCGRGMIARQDRLRGEFFNLTGGLGGVGLARGVHGADSVSPDDPRSFREFQQRAHLSATRAALAVRIANAQQAIEAYWAGAVQLMPASNDSAWGPAVVWFEGDRVARVLVNVQEHDRIGQLDDEIAALRGGPGTTSGAVTVWSVPGGELRVDLGASLALVLERRPSAPGGGT